MIIVRCNNCDWLGKEEDLDISHAEKGEWCPNCNAEDSCLIDVDYSCYFDKSEAKLLWELFGEIPIDNGDCIEEEFLGFEPGTNRFEIWKWFEDMFNLSVGEDLM